MAVADNSYIVTGADMVSVANKIREKAGVSDGLVWPDGLIEAIEGLKTDGARVETGTVTFAETVKTHTFVSDKPDIFIVHLDFLEPDKDSNIPVKKYTYKSLSDVDYIYAFIQYPKTWTYYTTKCKYIEYDIGFGTQSKVMYATFAINPSSKLGTGPKIASCLKAGATYRYWAIYGVTVE